MLKMNFFKYVLGLLMCCSLVACGFHFRSHVDIPREMHTIFIENPDRHSGMTALLAENLREFGVRVVKTEAESPLTLEILDERFSESKIVLGTAQQVNTVTLSYTVSFMLKRAHESVLSSPITLTSHTTYLQNANQILGDTSMQPTYQQALIRDMVNQILSHLSARNTHDALSH